MYIANITPNHPNVAWLWRLCFFLLLKRTEGSPRSRPLSALRVSSVLYGSGTDAGWVRRYDAAAAAISSAAKSSKHTARPGVKRRDSPSDTPTLGLDRQKRTRTALYATNKQTNGEKRRKIRGNTFYFFIFLVRVCTCSGCVFLPALGPHITAETSSRASASGSLFPVVSLRPEDQPGPPPPPPPPPPRWLLGAMAPGSARSWISKQRKER